MTSPLATRVHRRLVDAVAPGRSVEGADLDRALDAEAPLLPPAERRAVADEVLAATVGLGPLEPLLADPSITELMVNAGRVWVERRGSIERTALQLPSATVEVLIERVVAPLGLRVDRACPMVDARLPDGSRVNAVVPPLAIDGPCLTIRRFAARGVPLASFAPRPVVGLLEQAVRERRNIVVAGGTGAGKTTMLNALAGLIPPGERIVTVEDAAELRLSQAHVVRLEARPPNAEGVGRVTVRDLVRNALRMRPDRIVVGECRSGEALDMLQAMNTGHEGSLTTCHANGPADALRRLETMVLMGDVALPLDAVREQLVAAVDLVVQVARTAGGARRVLAVAEPVATEARVRTVVEQGEVVAPLERPPRSPC